jgi:hypothetical protein
MSDNGRSEDVPGVPVARGIVTFGCAAIFHQAWPSHPHLGLCAGLWIGILIAQLIRPRLKTKRVMLFLILSSVATGIYALVIHFRGLSH